MSSFSSNSIRAIKSTILPEIKCPQLRGQWQGTKTPSETEMGGNKKNYAFLLSLLLINISKVVVKFRIRDAVFPLPLY